MTPNEIDELCRNMRGKPYQENSLITAVNLALKMMLESNQKLARIEEVLRDIKGKESGR